MAYTPYQPQVSVVATVPASVSGVGQFNVNHTGNGSVQAVLLNSSVAVLQGTNPFFVQLTSGSIITAGGNSSVQVNNIVTGQSSVYLIPGVGVLGSVATLQGTNPWVISNPSVFIAGANPVSVATLQGTNPWMVQLTSGSVITEGSNSSVQVVGLMPPQSVSGVGLFNVNHTGAGSIFTGFRNDTVASTVGVDLTSRLISTDSAGRTITKPFAPNEATLQAVSSTVNIQSTSLIAAQGAGLRTYVTNINFANTGSVATLVNILDGDNSVLSRTIAPAGGGSNLIFPVPLRTNGFNQQVHYNAATAVSVLHATATGFKAP